ncbi:MAG: hypothetical protein IPM29_12430 [Planctomycetes bacterium]|nr:hypothetical protein [Planctomycetota bacterium]
MMRIHRTQLVLALLAALASPALAQDPPKKPDPEVAKKIDQLETALKDKRGEHDAEAAGLITELARGYADMHERDQRDVLKALELVFVPRKDDPEKPELYEQTIAALGTIGGTRASALLVKVYDRKPFTEDEWIAVREKILEAIGVTKDERQIEFLLDVAVRSPIDQMKRAAGHALRHFADAKGRVRHDIFSTLLIDYAKIEGEANAGADAGSSLIATRKATLSAIAVPWNETLAALSGVQKRTAVDWQAWWNDNKNDPKIWR